MTEETWIERGLRELAAYHNETADRIVATRDYYARNVCDQQPGHAERVAALAQAAQLHRGFADIATAALNHAPYIVTPAEFQKLNA